jgi:hypothetical protein
MTGTLMRLDRFATRKIARPKVALTHGFDDFDLRTTREAVNQYVSIVSAAY